MRLDFRLDVAEGALSDGGMDGPAADLEYVISGGCSKRGKLLGSPYSGLDIVVACLPCLFLREYVDCVWGAEGAGDGCSGALGRLDRRPDVFCSGLSTSETVRLGRREADDEAAAMGAAGAARESAGGPAGSPAAREDLAAWRAEERVALLLEDMSKY